MLTNSYVGSKDEKFKFNKFFFFPSKERYFHHLLLWIKKHLVSCFCPTTVCVKNLVSQKWTVDKFMRDPTNTCVKGTKFLKNPKTEKRRRKKAI